MSLGAAFAILVWLLIYCLVFGGALWLLRMFGGTLPPPLQTFLYVVIIVLAVLVLIYGVLEVMGGVPNLPRLRY